MSRIGTSFARTRREGRLALVAYLTIGYPTIEALPGLVGAVTAAGADLIELGIPFSDPLADGRTIQATSQVALQGGVTVVRALEAARRCREGVAIPLLFMTYLNPVLAYGVGQFCAHATDAGVDGVIVPDLPPDEAVGLREAAGRSGLDVVFFVAPTSTAARIGAACRAATGFIYCIAVTGITGARDQLDPAVLPLIERVRSHTDLPIVVGFGLSRREHLQALAGSADGAIVASALLDAIGKEPADPAGAAARFIHELTRAGSPGSP